MSKEYRPLERLAAQIERALMHDMKKAVEEMPKLLDKYIMPVAAEEIQKKYPRLFKLAVLPGVLVKAAAYGYGIVPEILTEAESKAWRKSLAESWDAGGMTLSEKLYGANQRMREAIIDTLRVQMRKNAAWTQAARELYDGYNSGKGVLIRQDLPKYLQKVRRATQGSQEQLRAARRAWWNIERLARYGAPTRMQKAAYAELVEAAEKGSEEMIKRACRTAIEEKCRYIAVRIIRTEIVRAWADGFLANVLKDDDVVAVKWKLSSRHPAFDLCDMYAKADMYGLGPGIFPKDKIPPLPVHPHCLCRLIPIYKGELKDAVNEQIRQAGDAWLRGLTGLQRRRVLGVEGELAWKKGDDWRKHARGWVGLRNAKSRLWAVERSYKWGVGTPICDLDYLSSEAYKAKFRNLSDNKRLNRAIYQRCKAMLIHQSGDYFEDLCILTEDKGELIGLTSGKVRNKTVYTDKLRTKIGGYGRNELISIHNHGTNLPPTGADFASLGYRGYKFGIVACHDGRVFYYSTKNAKPFTAMHFDNTVDKFMRTNYNLGKEDAIRKTMQQFVKDYGIEWREL